MPNPWNVGSARILAGLGFHSSGSAHQFFEPGVGAQRFKPRIMQEGMVSYPLKAVAASTGAGTGPIDIASASDGKFVYVLESGVGTLAAYRVTEIH